MGKIEFLLGIKKLSVLKPYLNYIVLSLLGLSRSFAMEENKEVREDLPCQMIEEELPFAGQRPSDDDVELFMTFVQFSNDKSASRSDRNLMPPPKYKNSKKRIFSTVFEELTDSEPSKKIQKIDTMVTHIVHPQVPRKVPITVLHQQPHIDIAPQESKSLSMFKGLF